MNLTVITRKACCWLEPILDHWLKQATCCVLGTIAVLFLSYHHPVVADIFHSGKVLRNATFDDQYGFASYSGRNGFQVHFTHTIIRSPDGFIWLGTDQGLFQFDGVQFSHFKFNQGDAVLPSINISHLAVGSDHSLWIGNESGLRILTNSSIHLPPGNILPNAEILALEPSRKNGMWVGTTRGLFLIVDHSVRYWNENDGLEDSHVISITHGIDDQLWVGTRKGIQILNTQDGSFSQNQHPKKDVQKPLTYGPYGNAVGSIHVTPVNEVFALFGSWKPKSYRLYRLVAQDWVLVKLEDDHIEGHQLVADTSVPTAFWITGAAEVKRLDLAQQDVHIYKPSNLLKADYIVTLFEPSKKGFVCGMVDKGLIHYTRRYHREILVEHHFRNGDTLRSVWGSLKNGLMIGADSGVYWNPDNTIVSDGDEDFIRKNLIRSVLIDQKGTFYKGATTGLFRKTTEEGGWHYMNLGKRLEGQPVNVLFEDSKGRIWIGTPHGGVVLAGKEILLEIDKDHGLNDDDIRGIAEDSIGNVWIITHGGGIYRFSDHFEWMGSQHPKGTERMRHFNSISIDSTDRIWLASDDGLHVWHEGHLQDLPKMEPIPNKINVIHADQIGLLWLGHFDGVNAIDGDTLYASISQPKPFVNSRMFGHDTGVGIDSIRGIYSQPTVYEDHEARVWFASENGLFGFDAALVRQSLKQELDTVVVSQVLADGDVLYESESFCQSAPNASNSILLSKVGKILLLEIKITAPTLSAPSAIRYKFKLEGYDNDWIDLGKDQMLRYSKLDPGQYTLLAAAAYAYSSNWKYAIPISLDIRKKLYQTAWFKAAFVGSILLGIAGFWTLWSRYLRRTYELRSIQRLQTEKQRIADDLHDDLGADLTKLMLTLDSAERTFNKGSDPKEKFLVAKSYLKKLGWRMRQSAWLLQSDCSSIDSLLDQIAMEMDEQLANSDTSSIQRHSDIPTDTILSSEMRHDLFLMAKEIITNAAKYACASKLEFDASWKEDLLILEFMDDGIGFNTNHQPKGNGIQNLWRRSNRIHASLSIRSEEGKGTRVIIMVKPK